MIIVSSCSTIQFFVRSQLLHVHMLLRDVRLKFPAAPNPAASTPFLPPLLYKLSFPPKLADLC